MSGITDKMNSIQALPWICIFTGCNYTPTFFKNGKKKPNWNNVKARSFYQLLNKMEEKRLDWRGYWCKRIFYMLYVWLQQGNMYEARYVDFKSKCKAEEAARLRLRLQNRVATLLETPENFRSSWNLLDFERELLILLEISWNFLISMFQRFVLESFTADTM